MTRSSPKRWARLMLDREARTREGDGPFRLSAAGSSCSKNLRTITRQKELRLEVAGDRVSVLVDVWTDEEGVERARILLDEPRRVVAFEHRAPERAPGEARTLSNGETHLVAGLIESALEDHERETEDRG